MRICSCAIQAPVGKKAPEDPSLNLLLGHLEKMGTFRVPQWEGAATGE